MADRILAETGDKILQEDGTSFIRTEVGFFVIVSTGARSTDSLSATTPAVDTTGANLLVAFLSNDAATIPAVTDSKGNVWERVTTLAIAGGARCTAFVSRPTSVGASHTFTSPSIGSARYPSIAVLAMQWTNGISYNGPPQFVVTGANSSVIQFIGVTPDRPDSLVVFGGSAENNWVPSGVSSPFTVDQGIAGLGAIAYGTFLGHVIQTAPIGAEPLVTMTGTGNINGIEFALLDALGEMRVSQDVVETAWPGDTAGRVSQDVVEVAHDGATVGRLSQDVIETALWTLGARVSQDCIEVAYTILDKVPPKGNNGHHGTPQGKKAFNTSNWIPWCEVNFFGGN